MKLRIQILTLLIFIAAAGYAGQPEAALAGAWDPQMRLHEAVDLNADPHILEINLEARVAKVQLSPNQEIEAWTYDGGLPGPLIRLKVGDRLIVHFTNSLPAASTVHWHGVRVPIAMDGVPGISQPEVQPGESFTYDFIVPDAGLFWYHPHVMSALQVGFGLTGPVLVEDPMDPVGVSDELVLVLSDIGIDKNQKLEDPDSGGSTGMAFGREGTHVLVNGRQGLKISARSGAPQRWRIVNTAKTRYFNLDIGDGNTFTKIGSDGGLQEYPVVSDLLLLAPGERADVIVAPRAKPGSELIVRSQLFDRGYGTIENRQVEDLFTIAMTNEPAAPQWKFNVDLQPRIEPLSALGATDVSLALTMKQHAKDGSFEYGINDVPYWKAESIPARLGETQLWTVENKTAWSHPLHIHGFFFQVIDKNGAPVRPLEWKDTVNVPYKQTLRLLVRFEDRPGTWMVHCHILDHAEGGLMTTVQVGDAPHGAPHSEHERH